MPVASVYALMYPPAASSCVSRTSVPGIDADTEIALRSSPPTATIIGRRHRIDRFILPSLDRASHWYSRTKPPAQDRQRRPSCQALYQPLPVHVVSSWPGSAGFHMDHREERVVLS